MIQPLTPDGRFLFITRIARMFGYGFLSVVLILYLEQVGLSQVQIGLLLTLTLIGDTIISLWITTNADRIGRRRMLIVGALLMVFAGVLFAVTRNFLFLLIAATIGVISPSGYEVGPFLSIEQAALSQIFSNERRTHIFAWYNLVGSFATALGALGGGGLVQAFQDSGMTPLGSYRTIVIGYAIIGLILGVLFTRLSPAVEIQAGSDPIPFHLCVQNSFWSASFAGGGAQTICFVLHRCFRRWLCFTKYPGLLVSCTFQCAASDTWKHFLRGKYPCWPLSPKRCMGGLQDRPHQNDGIHAHSLKYLVDTGAAHAELTFSHSGPIIAFQHFTDGCANPPILHHGCRGSG